MLFGFSATLFTAESSNQTLHYYGITKNDFYDKLFMINKIIYDKNKPILTENNYYFNKNYLVTNKQFFFCNGHIYLIANDFKSSFSVRSMLPICPLMKYFTLPYFFFFFLVLFDHKICYPPFIFYKCYR